MDQRNTIVKCNATTCLYNYKGICEQYVINLDMYGQCNEYEECEKTETPAELKPNEAVLPERGQRAKGNIIEGSWLTPRPIKETCIPFVIGVDLSDDKV